MDGADFQQAIFEQLADAQALGAGEGEVELARDATLEQVQVLGAPDAGHDHVQVVQLAGVGLGQGAGEEIRLLLVVALQHHAVAGHDQGFEGRDDLVRWQHHAIGQGPYLVETALLLAATARPTGLRGHCYCHARSW
ncbi:hypothetical protein D9M71_137310 [compost metagenome]